MHEGDRSRRDDTHTLRAHTRWTQGREIETDAATHLHRQCTLAQRSENTVERILDQAHHKTVEERDIATGTRTGKDAATGKKTEIIQDRTEALCVSFRVGFHRR